MVLRRDTDRRLRALCCTRSPRVRGMKDKGINVGSLESRVARKLGRPVGRVVKISPILHMAECGLQIGSGCPPYMR